MTDGLDWTVLLKLLLVIVLVVANGFFVAAEFSLVAIRRSRIEQLGHEGHWLAPDLAKASDNLDAYLAATQLGITLSSLGLGWIGEPAVAAVLEPLLGHLPAPFDVLGSHAVAFVIAFSLITTMHIVFGELMPKSLALQKAETVSLAIVRPLAVFLVLFRPAIFVLNGFANWMLRKIGLQNTSGEEHLHSPEELKLLFDAASRAGLIQEEQGDLVDRALTLGERKIASCMTPRADFEWIDATAPFSEIRQMIIASSHSRFPVHSPDFGTHAMVTAKAVLSLDAGLARLPPESALPAVVVYENAAVLHILDQFRRNRTEWALVVDQHGEVQGLVTTHDLFDALAGDADAYPIEVPSSDTHDAEPVEEQVFDAGISMDEFRRQLRRPRLGADDLRGYHTVAGFVLERLRYLPEVGTTFRQDELCFEVKAMDKLRITRLSVKSVDDSSCGVVTKH
ncbi:hemolysin family protein [uncultured Paracoccus sp.]|uniref:hemolysin family protein n=1 Tax=uncultured Paracoccus sp. TaxID=189685 RepID=UPI00261EAC54|nr:hemolysin family protein [uncultured Paracoccus sp.]